MASEQELVEFVFSKMQHFRVADTFGAAEALEKALPQIMQPDASSERAEAGQAISAMLDALNQTPRPDMVPPWETAMDRVKAWRATVG